MMVDDEDGVGDYYDGANNDYDADCHDNEASTMKLI